MNERRIKYWPKGEKKNYFILYSHYHLRRLFLRQVVCLTGIFFLRPSRYFFLLLYFIEYTYHLSLSYHRSRIEWHTSHILIISFHRRQTILFIRIIVDMFFFPTQYCLEGKSRCIMIEKKTREKCTRIYSLHFFLLFKLNGMSCKKAWV